VAVGGAGDRGPADRGSGNRPVAEWAPEVRVVEALARRLIRDQFPQLEAESYRLLGEGWDNTVWLVDEHWVFRFPRRAMVIPGFMNEIAHLPALAPLLPLAIPVPTLVGEPSAAFRWPFYGAPFLPGRELAEADLDDDARAALAVPLAEFLRALHGLELEAALPLDPVRRADMPFRVERTRDRMDRLRGEDLWHAPPLVEELLAQAESIPPPEPATVCHGDLHLRHLLVGEDGEPAAVIDWVDLSRNDPAVDLVLFWSTLPPESRRTFLDAYGEVTDQQLLRAQVLSLFLCGTLALFGRHEGMPALEREALAGLDRTLAS
jgi:aminoglycoside phosphotransferase (APT) family kinase protein